MTQQKSPFYDHPLFNLENIHRAYRKCRRRKRRTTNAMKFEMDLEENMVNLRAELVSGEYRPGRAIAFLVKKPKRREIFAADFRDRIVHHILVGHLEPSWERRFIHDSYACRKGKGTHKGVERLGSFCRKATANGTRRAWYLQLDIHGFFMAIHRDVLYERLAAKEEDPAVLWLLHALVFHDPTANCRLRRCARSDFEALPLHKTLFKAGPGRGLPIGNLTSQFFANVYLDALDQFVKHRLKVRWYVRYCDDMVLAADDPGQLKGWEREIETFLDKTLLLKLNPKKRLRPVSDGIDFLGYIIRPSHLLVRRRVVGACAARLNLALGMNSETESIKPAQSQFGLTGAAPVAATTGFSRFHKIQPGILIPGAWHWETIDRVHKWLNSYLGHFSKASSYHLIQRLWRRFPLLDEYFVFHGVKVDCRYPTPKPLLRFSQQKIFFSKQLKGHVIVAQVGKWREIWGGTPGNPISEEKMRFRERHLPEMARLLWESGLPVAWIEETGNQPTGIRERRMVCRWGPGLSENTASE